MNLSVFLKRVKRKLHSIIGSPRNYIEAQKSLNCVKRNKSKNETVIICTPLLGDTIYALSCLDALKEKEPDKKIHIYSYRKFHKLLKTYQAIDNVTYIDSLGNESYRGLDAFVHFSQLSEKAKQEAIINGNPFYYKACYKAKNPDIIYQLKTYIYNVGIDKSITYHGINKSKKDLKREKIAILNPYSFSVYGVSFNLYQKIAKKLMKQGYIVYTNIIETQKIIDGTKELRCSIYELFELACKSKVIISTRSGILDFLAPSDINMFVIYENCSNRIRKMCHLTNWNCKGFIKEEYLNVSGCTHLDVYTDFCEYIRNIE